MKIMIVALFAVVALLVLPPLHAKPLTDNTSLRNRILSELLQRMVDEQEEALAQEEERYGVDQYMEEENAADEMGTELEIAESEAAARRGGKGVTYIRWGHNKCPSVGTTVRLHEGVTAGTFYNVKGGSANYLCMPHEPDYSELDTTLPSYRSTLYNTEYEFPIKGVHDHDAPCALCYNTPCALCYNTLDNTEVMIPGKTSCPAGWTRDYYGYLMGPDNWGDRSPKDYICVDKEQVSSHGSSVGQNGALLYHVVVSCSNGLHCPSYDANKILTCVVCSK